MLAKVRSGNKKCAERKCYAYKNPAVYQTLISVASFSKAP